MDVRISLPFKIEFDIVGIEEGSPSPEKRRPCSACRSHRGIRYADETSVMMTPACISNVGADHCGIMAAV